MGAIDEVVSVADLASRNGTFVNDQRVHARRALFHGARLRIGSTRFVLVTSMSEESFLETGTVAQEDLAWGRLEPGALDALQRAGRGAHFAGQLGSFGVIELLRVFEQTGRSGTLHVSLPGDEEARVEVRDGETRAVHFAGQEGFPALLALAPVDTGVFWLVEHAAPCEANVTGPTGRLLFEVCCALDEAATVPREPA